MSLPPDLPNDDELAAEILSSAAEIPPDGPQSGQITSKKAVQILADKGIGFVIPTAQQRLNLLVAFARKGKVVYGKAFDIVRLHSAIDLNDESEITENLSSVVLLEVKATKKPLAPDFKGFFFALTAGEVLVSQSLKEQFRFAFVNTTTGDFLELTLPQIFSRARGIYPTWSISF